MLQHRIDLLATMLTAPLLVTKKEHLIYLTGHSFIDGSLLVYPKSSRKPPIFLGFALESPRGLKFGAFHEMAKYVKPFKSLGIESFTSVKEFEHIKKMLKGVTCKAVISPVSMMREIKSAEEIANLQEVAQLTAAVFDIMKRKLKSQRWTEIGLARYIRVWGLELGADDVSFDPIVATGKNSAVPHHHPTEQIIKSGEPIVLDFGFKLNGYCSDFTRTVFLKSASSKMRQVYNHVEAAYLESLQTAQSGMTGGELDAIARAYLKHVKLEKYFIHSLGHGTGLEVHELPFVGPQADNVLSDGMVFSIEPGVYQPKTGGVRIEDLVYLDNGRAHRLAMVDTALKSNIIL